MLCLREAGLTNLNNKINAVAPGVIKSTGTDRYSPDLIEKYVKELAFKATECFHF